MTSPMGFFYLQPVRTVQAYGPMLPTTSSHRLSDVEIACTGHDDVLGVLQHCSRRGPSVSGRRAVVRARAGGNNARQGVHHAYARKLWVWGCGARRGASEAPRRTVGQKRRTHCRVDKKDFPGGADGNSRGITSDRRCRRPAIADESVAAYYACERRKDARLRGALRDGDRQQRALHFIGAACRMVLVSGAAL